MTRNFYDLEVCLLTADTGTCREGNQRRWYYDNSRGECIAFIYSGCGGNANNFYSHNECLQTCSQLIHGIYEPEPQPQPQPEPQPEVDVCQQYRNECSTLRCQYGMKGYVENLCNRCKCVDPCDGVTCPEATRCAVELNRNQADESDVSTFVGVCKEVNKPGDCPFLRGSGEECREDCRDDADCLMDLKCCSNGCGHICVMPSITTLAPPAELRTTVGYAPGYTQGPVDRGTFAPEVIEEEFHPVVTAGEGDYATLKCAVRGNPKPVFTWSKNNVLIDGKEPRYRILLEGAALQIISLYKTDAGIYLCSADNNIGKPLQKEIRLDVIVPVRANITLANTNYPIGSDINVPCDVEGYPIPTVQWYKDGNHLTPSPTVQITESHRLIIKNATESDSGEYRCAAWNQYSNATSTIPLLVQGRFIHPSCKDNPFFANCQLIIKANFCSHKYYARFCCRSCTKAGMLPSVGPHLRPDTIQNDVA